MDDTHAHHYDFTTASELEVFIAQLEEIMQEWGLNRTTYCPQLQHNEFLTGQWCSFTEILTFLEEKFELKRHYLISQKLEDVDIIDNTENPEESAPQIIQDMMSTENDFIISSHIHPIARWYGLRDFITLTSLDKTYVPSESKVKTLLSALAIAANNSKCTVPFFMSALPPWQNYFLGMYISGNFHTEFSMVHLNQIPSHCKFLTGLLTMFKSKIGLDRPIDPVIVSVQFTYVLKDWVNSIYIQEPVYFDLFEDHDIDFSQWGILPFGSTKDPIDQLYLQTLWPLFQENSVVDGENHSDLEPIQAPVWKVFFTANDSTCLLTNYYTSFITLTKRKHCVKDILGIFSNTSMSAKSSELSSFNAMQSKASAFSKCSLGSERFSKGSVQSMQLEGPIPTKLLMKLLYYLFPDADPLSTFPYCEQLGGKPLGNQKNKMPIPKIDQRLKEMKSAPYDGLLWRLSIVMSHVIYLMKSERFAAYLWYEFIQELRYRCLNCIVIPGLESSLPNYRTCLLNQKLQLLNCCISRRLEREELPAKDVMVEDEVEESDDEFYDCITEVTSGDEESSKKTRGQKYAPVGRLTRHGNLRLLANGEPLYIPVTQDVVPKTEDQLEEDAEVLLQLGTDAKASQLRAKILSASLFSDMEAFKAANPGCVLADFIRWYSPRDWVEEEGVDRYGTRRGHLSHRMEMSGNTWTEVWDVSQPVAAKYQKRLFNEVREYEKILNFLEGQSPKEFIELLLPVMIVCVIQKLLDEAAGNNLPGIRENLNKLIKKAETLGKMPKIDATLYEELITEIRQIDSILVQVNSLKYKFVGEQKECNKEDISTHKAIMKFIMDLLSNAEVEVPQGPKSQIGSRICYFFSEAAKAKKLAGELHERGTNEKSSAASSSFPRPDRKELILRLPGANKGPQKLHATITDQGFRLCGAFTKNTYFPF